MIRLLLIGIFIILCIWVFNNFSSNNKKPLSNKINPLLRVIFITLIFLIVILILPKLGFNPLAVIQKIIPLISLI